MAARKSLVLGRKARAVVIRFCVEVLAALGGKKNPRQRRGFFAGLKAFDISLGTILRFAPRTSRG
jgi:hypothetical protein